MSVELAVAIVMVPFDSSLLDHPVHPFNLAVGPWMPDLGEPVLDAVLVAPHVEHVRDVLGRWAVAYRGRKVNRIPLSVRSVWILHGTAAFKATRKAEAGVLPILATSWTKVNLLVRSIATCR